jgi:hypothetical protein
MNNIKFFNKQGKPIYKSFTEFLGLNDRKLRELERRAEKGYRVTRKNGKSVKVPISKEEQEKADRELNALLIGAYALANNIDLQELKLLIDLKSKVKQTQKKDLKSEQYKII